MKIRIKKKYLSNHKYWEDYWYPLQSIFFIVSVGLILIVIPYFIYKSKMYDVNWKMFISSIVVIVLGGFAFGLQDEEVKQKKK